MQTLKFAVLGCGFWAQYQVPAWLELEKVELTALYNRTIENARELGLKYGIDRIYNDAEELFKNEKIDFVDIITDVDTHAHFTLMAARYGVTVICQKPMAPAFHIAVEMIEACRKSNVDFYIHENFRWQAPVRKLKEIMSSGIIGRPFKARVSFCSSYPVYDNQPFLAQVSHFIIADLGSHILDISRFLLGEVDSLYCQTKRVNPQIRGEDVANIFLTMKNGVLCSVEMSYASILELESFPETIILIEGENGSIELKHNFELQITTRETTYKIKAIPASYEWMDPNYSLVHSSIVDCNRNLLQAIRGEGKAETTASDNFETVRLVWASYESAETNRVIKMDKYYQGVIIPQKHITADTKNSLT